MYDINTPPDICFLGFKFEEACDLTKISNEAKKDISKTCCKFTKKLVEEIRARLPSNFEILQKINLLNVKNVLSHCKEDIMPLAVQFESDVEILSSIEKGWRMIHLMQWNNIDSTLEFWTEVECYRDAVNINPFNALANIAFKILSLPYSNAEVERVFSSMNLFKSKIRNRMSLNVVNALLHIKNGLKRENSCCENYQLPYSFNCHINSNEVYKTSEFEMKSALWPNDNNNDENISFIDLE